MAFESYLPARNILPKIATLDRLSTIAYVIGHVNQLSPFDTTGIAKAIFAHEKELSKHGSEFVIISQSDMSIPDFIISLATIKNPFQWGQSHSKPVKVFAIVLTNPSYAAEQVVIANELYNILADETTRASIVNMDTAAQIATVLNSVKGRF